MGDRDRRIDRLRRRLEREAPDDEPETVGGDETADGTDGIAPERATTSLKDRPSVLMYLPEDVRAELDIRFDELNARHKREHGEPLEKNRDYYPAVIEAGLEGTDLEDLLDL